MLCRGAGSTHNAANGYFFDLTQTLRCDRFPSLWGRPEQMKMENEMTLPQMLDSIRDIFARDLNGKPAPCNKAVADPALWRAIQNQERHRNEGQCGFRPTPEKA